MIWDHIKITLATCKNDNQAFATATIFCKVTDTGEFLKLTSSSFCAACDLRRQHMLLPFFWRFLSFWQLQLLFGRSFCISSFPSL